MAFENPPCEYNMFYSVRGNRHYDSSEYGCLKQSVRGTWHFVQYQAAPAHGCDGEVQSEHGCESAPVAVRY